METKKKTTIRLTEGELKNMITETVKKVLKEYHPQYGVGYDGNDDVTYRSGGYDDDYRDRENAMKQGELERKKRMEQDSRSTEIQAFYNKFYSDVVSYDQRARNMNPTEFYNAYAASYGY